MNERNREELRTLLRSLSQARPEQVDAGWDAALGGILAARFSADEALVSDGLRERTLARMREAAPVREAPKSSNGQYTGLAVFLSKVRGKQPVSKPGFLIAAIACVAVILLVVFLATRTGKRELVKRPPIEQRQPIPKNTPKQGQGELVHKTPAPNAKPRELEPHPNKPSKRGSTPRTNQTPRREDLVVRKVEVGKAGKVIGWPTIRHSGQRQGKFLKPGDTLYADSVIETGDADKLDLAFNDGTSIALDFDTSVTLPGGSPDTIKLVGRPREIRVTKGSIVASVVHAADKSPFVVRTPVAIAEDVGTVFSLSLEKSAKPTEALKAVLQVKEGKVAFFNAYGRVVAGALTESTAAENSAPSEPRRIQSFLLHVPGSDVTFMVASGALDERGAVRLEAYAAGWAGLEVSGPIGEPGVERVLTGSPADSAGLQPGDIVVSLNGQTMLKPIEVTLGIFSNPRAKVTLGVRRKSRTGIVTIVLTPELRVSAPLPADPKIAGGLRELTDLSLTGKRALARRKLMDLLTRQPNAPTYNNLGVLDQMDDHLGAAIRRYQVAAHLDPSCALYHSNMGQALNLIGNGQRALDELRVGAELDTAGWERLCNLADALNLAGLHDEALNVAERAIRRNPKAADPWISKAQILSSMGRGEDAVVAGKRVVEIEPRTADSWTILADALMMAGQNEQAEVSYKRALGISSGDMPALDDYGALLLSMGRLADSARVFQKLTEVAPKFGAGYDNLSAVLFRLGRVKEAETAARKAIEIDIRDVFAHIALGRALRELGKLQEAEAECRKAIELDPNLPDVHTSLASLLASRGRYYGAEAECRRALEIDPKYGPPHATLGFVYDRQKRFELAESEYRIAISMSPKNWVNYSNLGLMLASLNRPVEAEAEMRKSVEVGARLPGSHTAFAKFLANSGRYGEAEAELKSAVEVAGPNKRLAASAMVRLGALFEKKGDKPAALAAYRGAATMDPANKEAQDALKRLGA